MEGASGDDWISGAQSMRAYLRASLIACILSRIGELVLNPFVGPRFKSGVVTTNMPATADKPIDIEMIEATPVTPPKGSNARSLSFDRKARDTDGFAMFPPSAGPPGPDGMAPFPLDRAAGVAASQAAEHPDDARRRSQNRS